MSTKSALPLPTPLAMPTAFPGPATMPHVHNATAFERARGLAREMADRHGRGDYNVAADQQTRNNIDQLVGRVVDGVVVWPQALIDLSGTTLRRTAK